MDRLTIFAFLSGEAASLTFPPPAGRAEGKLFDINFFFAAPLRSCGKSEIKFVHQRPEFLAESFVDRAENIVGFEMLAIDAAAGADVVAHLFEPGELVGS